MARAKTPKLRHDGPVSVLYDRGTFRPETEIGGVKYIAAETVNLPDIYRIVTEVELPFYLTSDGKHAPGKDADIAAEFAAIEGAKAKE
jgi:hypothetical protein